MFHNYFFLKKLATDLHHAMTGVKLVECFSQNKDELILGFASAKKSIFIRANLNPQISLLHISDDFKRARKNSVDLFDQVIGQEVSAVRVFDFERSITIQFQSGLQLIFKMHGSRSNMLLADQEQTLAIFRHNLSGDQEITPQELHQAPTITSEALHEVNGDPIKFLPALGKEVRSYLDQQGYQNAAPEHQWTLMQTVLDLLETAPVHIYQSGDMPALTLLPTESETLLTTHDTIAACAFYYEQFTRHFYLNHERKKATRPLQDDIKKTESYLKKTAHKLNEIKNRRGYDEIANILMANLHQIQKGKKQVRLYDFYADREIDIKLNPELSPQKNAENLYRKSKNQQIEINKLEENIRQRTEKLETQREKLEQLQSSDNIKAIRNIAPPAQAQQKTDRPLPYHQYEFESYQIMVGKNARHNDELTLKIANKNDLWLHAKDVAGSHVVIRHQAGKGFPKQVIERAAQLAGWFSKRKTDTLCPVIYTPKKYVRKRKGDPAGAVVVEQEEITMVEPKNFE